VLLESPDELQEGFELVEGGSIAELGPDRFIAVRREPDSEKGNFLVKLNVTSNDPITLVGTYRTHEELCTIGIAPSDR
jgi:hypothetical protein